MIRFSTSVTFGLMLAGSAPCVAHSQVYMTEDQAAHAILAGETSLRKTIELTPEEIKMIEARSGESVRSSKVAVWVTADKKAVFIDQVLGKHEFITFAVGVSENQSVSGVEILEYRETYGQQVRGSEWRKQFLGKNSSAPLRLKQDIVNISGATLSSAHVTGGVRRLLHTYEIIRSRL